MLVILPASRLAAKRPTRHFAALAHRTKDSMARFNSWLFDSRKQARKALSPEKEIPTPEPTFGWRSEKDVGNSAIPAQTAPTPEPDAAAAMAEPNGGAAGFWARLEDEEDTLLPVPPAPEPKSNPEIEAYIPMARRHRGSRRDWWDKWAYKPVPTPA